MTDLHWPRDKAWPTPRAFDRTAALAAIATKETDETITSYDPATERTTQAVERHYTPVVEWSTLVREPNLGEAEGAFYYAVLWKEPAVPVEKATAKPPRDPLAHVHADLAEHVPPAWFDERAYWCSVAGMLSREDLARFVGDARIFAHSYKEGGTSIITGSSARTRFVEGFYQTLVPYFGAAEWDVVATELPPIDDTLLRKDEALSKQILRLAAASGRFDAQILAMLDTAKQAGVPLFDVLHALRDPALLASHAPRLDIKLLSPLSLEKWIDRFGDTQMGWIEASLAAVTTKKDQKPLEAIVKRAFKAPKKPKSR